VIFSFSTNDEPQQREHQVEEEQRQQRSLSFPTASFPSCNSTSNNQTDQVIIDIPSETGEEQVAIVMPQDIEDKSQKKCFPCSRHLISIVVVLLLILLMYILFVFFQANDAQSKTSPTPQLKIVPDHASILDPNSPIWKLQKNMQK